MTLEASRKRLEDIPGGFQDAPGRSGTLLEASGTLLDAVGRSWKLPLESRTAQEGPNTTPVVCFVAPGCLQDAPGRSNITPVVFFGTAGVSKAGRDWRAGPHQDVFFLLFFII